MSPVVGLLAHRWMPTRSTADWARPHEQAVEEVTHRERGCTPKDRGNGRTGHDSLNG
jgi:hypothetical protein